VWEPPILRKGRPPRHPLSISRLARSSPFAPLPRERVRSLPRSGPTLAVPKRCYRTAPCKESSHPSWVDFWVRLAFPSATERPTDRCGRRVPFCGQGAKDGCQKSKVDGLTDVAFHKKRNLAIAGVAKSAWVYCGLRNFRAGTKAGMSCFRRGALQVARAPTTSRRTWSAVVAQNHVLLSRLKPG
jgi:hypothetical protein